MNKGYVQVFYGDGKGKTSAALGKALLGLSFGKRITIIQFLKEKDPIKDEFINGLGSDIKLFRFEKSKDRFNQLAEEEKEEEMLNIRNGINFAKKVLSTQDCDILILDEVLGLIEEGILTREELISIVDSRDEEMDLILTGLHMPQELIEHVDEISKIISEKDCIDNENRRCYDVIN